MEGRREGAGRAAAEGMHPTKTVTSLPPGSRAHGLTVTPSADGSVPTALDRALGGDQHLPVVATRFPQRMTLPGRRSGAMWCQQETFCAAGSHPDAHGHTHAHAQMHTDTPMLTHTCTRTYPRSHPDAHGHIHAHAQMHTDTCSHTCTWTHPHTHMPTDTPTLTHTCTRTHPRSHTCTRTHPHVPTRCPSLLSHTDCVQSRFRPLSFMCVSQLEQQWELLRRHRVHSF